MGQRQRNTPAPKRSTRVADTAISVNFFSPKPGLVIIE